MEQAGPFGSGKSTEEKMDDMENIIKYFSTRPKKT
jgi:hypothetical protein